MKALLASVLAGGIAVGCAQGDRETTDGPRPMSDHASSLPPGIVAMVGSTAITGALVARVAARQGVSPREALEREASDCVLASGAHERGYAEQPQVRAAIRGVLARARLESLREGTSASSVEPSEVEEASARHFVEFDRPEAFRVIHALVKLPDKPSDEMKLRARLVSEALAASLAGARDEADFKRRAQAMDKHEGFEIVVESLMPVAADGRVVDVDQATSGGSFEQPFARAAAHLQHVGDQSPVVGTSFGFHVLMLLDRVPALVVPYDERASRLHDEILTIRSKNARARLAEELRNRRGVQVERSADSLIASVNVAAHEAP